MIVRKRTLERLKRENQDLHAQQDQDLRAQLAAAEASLRLAHLGRPSERQVMLAEYDLLRGLGQLTAIQLVRAQELERKLWPPPERNPMNGIRRIPGGHGYPVNTGPAARKLRGLPGGRVPGA